MDWKDWVPEELRSYLGDNQDNITPEIIKRYKVLQEAPWVKNRPKEKEIEKRLLTDSRMAQVWLLFKNIPDKDREQKIINFFIQIRGGIFFDAEDRKLSKKQQQMKENFKSSIVNQIRKLKATINEVDDFCSQLGTRTLVKKEPLRGNKSFKNLADEIGDGLNEQLDGYRKNHRPRIEVKSDKSKNVKYHGIDDYTEIYIRETISHLFRDLFKQPHVVPAQIVAWVVLGIPTPKGILNEEIKERFRGRTKTAHRRSKKS